MAPGWKLPAAAIAAALLWLAAPPAQAQNTPTYKCSARGKVVYTQIPCPGGRQLGARAKRETDRYRTPSQDRARIARRAQLSAEGRRECTGLDGTLKQEQAMLKAKGDAATLQDEMPLVRAKKRYRELGC